MVPAKLDPSPRTYPAALTLKRRANRGASAAPAATTLEAIEAWLLSDAIREDDLLALFEALVWRLVAAGIPLDRASLHAGTLHPQLIGFAWNWERADGLCDETQVAAAALESDSYRKNPIFRTIEYGEAFRGNTGDPETVSRYPLMAQLAQQGIVDYMLMPLVSGAYHNAATAATKHPNGFSDTEVAAIRRIFALFGLHVGRHIMLRIAGNVLDTYLGTAAGTEVLAGSIQRGSGKSIRAIIWASDLRGFTDLADRLSGPQMTTLLNAYFERMAGAVLAHGGEVLKFIGDGLLAVFPLDGFSSAEDAAKSALAAAEQALADIETLNTAPPDDLAAISGWQPLRSGIALHEGDVFFGNVGAAERLDFTVIGQAVNAASRVEALSKTLGRSLLITDPVAARLGCSLDDLGRHTLRGLSQPIGIFSPASAT
jgi:adenylate cyclase